MSWIYAWVWNEFEENVMAFYLACIMYIYQVYV